MKLTRKIISVLLAAVMIFSMVPLVVSADSTDSLDEFLDADNLTDFVDDLLEKLANRKEEVTGTILSLVYLFIDDSDFQACIGTTDVLTASDEKLADILVDYIDDYLLPDLLADFDDYLWLVDVLVGLTTLWGGLDDTSDLVLFLASAGNSSLVTGLGDLKYLDTSDLFDGSVKKKNVICTDNGYSNLEMLYALIDFLACDGTISIISELLHGTFNLGKIKVLGVTLYDLDEELDFIDDINETMSELPTLIKEYIYEYLLPTYNSSGTLISYSKSVYASYSSDELIGAVLLKYLGVDSITQSAASSVTGLTFYELIGTYAGDVIETYLLDYINDDLKTLLETVVSYEGFEGVGELINSDYSVDSSAFDLSDVSTEGIISKLNTILCGLLSSILTEDAVAAIGLVDGDNTNLMTNLENTLKVILAAYPDEYDGYDFTSAKSQLDSLSLEEIAVEVIKPFLISWLNTTTDHFDEIETIEELVAYIAYVAVDKYIAEKYDTWLISYDDALFDDDGAIVDEDDDYFIELALNIGLDAAVWALDHNSSVTYFELSPETAVAYKEAGWTWVDFLDEILDWALNLIDGLPAVADELSTVSGETDTFGPFYKLNVILNNLISLAFINNCGDGYFPVDVETIFNAVADAVFDLDLSGLSGVLDVNSDSDNYFAMPVISGVLNLLTDLIDGLFVYDTSTGSEVYILEDGESVYHYTLGSSDYYYHLIASDHSYTSAITTAATCEADGVRTYTCTYCGDTYTESVDAIGHSWNGGTVTTAATCEENGVITYICQNDSSHTYTEEIAATGHSYEAAVTDPTCTEQGYTTYTCTVCGDSYISDYTDATGHSYDSGTVTTAATCTATGVLTYTCTVCGSTYTEEIAATGHSMTYIAAVDATATEAGNIAYYYCSECGKYFADGDGATEITYASTIIEATGELELTDDSEYIIDKENAIVYVTDAQATGVTADEFAANFDVEVPVSGDEILSSGYTFTFVGTTYLVVVIGDVDMNGEITMSDARAALRLALSVATAEEQEGYDEKAADVNLDGSASLAEARAILRYALSLDVTLSA